MGFSFTDWYDDKSNASIQGQLSKSYEAWLSTELKGLADYVGYIYWKSGASVEDAKAVVKAISEGKFKLDDLQSSAQSKIGPVDGSAMKAPNPVVVVNGVTISIKDMLGGLDTETWKDSGKNGQFHTREFYTSSHEPDGYSSDWSNPPKPNGAPTADKIYVNATETQSTYDANHHVDNRHVEDLKVVDLIEDAQAKDPDGDVLSTGGYQFFDKDNKPIDMPDYITIVGGKLIIDQNHIDLDDLRVGEHRELSLTYNIDDGQGHTISNTAYIHIEGTKDIYQEHGSFHVEQTHLRSDSTTGGGNINHNVLELKFSEAADGGFDFTATGGTLTATQSGLTGNQKVNVVDWVDSKAGAGVDFTKTINLTEDSPTDTSALSASALNDNKIDYNVGFNGQADPTDSVTVRVDYTYDYWHWA
ncbi:hypothetical protein [Mesorhizobium sp. KR2-14]|uniref:hypothetical protein n=1 Tax=Mesorhizobium sp. KR2-14 TaxID=3156610 RepID=UPI0032B40485